MNNRLLEAVIVGIITALVAGFTGVGAHRPVSAAPATVATASEGEFALQSVDRFLTRASDFAYSSMKE